MSFLLMTALCIGNLLAALFTLLLLDLTMHMLSMSSINLCLDLGHLIFLQFLDPLLH